MNPFILIKSWITCLTILFKKVMLQRLLVSHAKKKRDFYRRKVFEDIKMEFHNDRLKHRHSKIVRLAMLITIEITFFWLITKLNPFITNES